MAVLELAQTKFVWFCTGHDEQYMLAVTD